MMEGKGAQGGGRIVRRRGRDIWMDDDVNGVFMGERTGRACGWEFRWGIRRQKKGGRTKMSRRDSCIHPANPSGADQAVFAHTMMVQAPEGLGRGGLVHSLESTWWTGAEHSLASSRGRECVPVLGSSRRCGF